MIRSDFNKKGFIRYLGMVEYSINHQYDIPLKCALLL